MNHRLDDHERRQMETDGYVLRERVFTPEEVGAIVEACEALVDEVVQRRRRERLTAGSYTFEDDPEVKLMVKWEGDSDVVHGLEPFAHLSDPLAVTAMDPRFVEPMIDFVDDPEPMLFTEKLNLKRPHHGGVNPLHQDFPYWSDAQDASRIATAMLFLDDADLGNGTLEVVPGSHRNGPWQTRADKDVFGNLEIDPSLEEGLRTVPLEVPAGSVVYFGPLLVHRSAPNTSDRERRSLLFSYQPAGAPDMRDLLGGVLRDAIGAVTDQTKPLQPLWEPEFSLGQLYNKGLFLLGYVPELTEFATAVLEGRPPVAGTLDDAWHLTRLFEAFAEGPGRDIDLRRPRP